MLAPSPSLLSRSRLADVIERLSSCSGSFFFYEPRERLRSGEPGSPLVWQSVSPNEAESLSSSELDHCSLALCSSLSGSLALSPLEAVEKISRKKLWQSVSLLWVPDHCQSGDYGGSVYALSNAQALLEEHGSSPSCRELMGGHGSYALALDPRYVSENLLEAMESLENYPLYNEEHCSFLEESLKEEAFSSWLRSDLLRFIEKAFSFLLAEEGLSEEEAEEEAEKRAESLSEDQLWQLLREADSDGCLWSPEHNSMYCDLDRIPEDLLSELLSSSAS
jgi:hypothetical protein